MATVAFFPSSGFSVAYLLLFFLRRVATMTTTGAVATVSVLEDFPGALVASPGVPVASLTRSPPVLVCLATLAVLASRACLAHRARCPGITWLVAAVRPMRV